MMAKLINPIKQLVRSQMDYVARGLNALTGGKLHPDTVTIVGALMHLPIAYCIAVGQLVPAAILLVIFGLFDTLDGSLARLQKRASATGMLLDASTDRMKEVMLYAGIVYLFAASNAHPLFLVATVVACGASLCVSYVKAKGEAAFSASGARLAPDKLNRVFSDGFLTFEVRMTLLVVGLLANQLPWAVAFIAVFATYTALWRLATISGALRRQ